jgi:hypothetical protein
MRALGSKLPTPSGGTRLQGPQARFRCRLSFMTLDPTTWGGVPVGRPPQVA